MSINCISNHSLADSPLMKTKSSLSNSFRTIAYNLLFPLYRNFSIEEAYARVKQAYCLEKDEADIIALYLSRSDRRSPSDDILQRLTLPDVHLQKCLDKLKQRLFIIDSFDWEQIEPAHALDEAFILSVQEDIPLFDAQARLLENLFDQAVENPLGAPEKKAVPKRKAPKAPMNGGDPPVMMDENDENDEDDPGSFFRQTAIIAENTLIKKLDEALIRYDGQPFGAKLLHLIGELSHTQKMVLFYMLREFKHHFIQPVRPAELSGAITQIFADEVGTLMEKGLICSCYVWNREANSSDTEHYRITPELAAVFKGREKIIDMSAVSSIGTLVTSESIDQKELFFPVDDCKDMERIRLAAIPAEYDRIISQLKVRKLRPCLSVLMYGPPGTGKTEFALQVARETGRSLLKADVSKLNGIFIGEGIINFRNLFQTYRYICAVSNLAPILFLDEGDGMMSKRITDIQRTVDKDSNSIQNVLLEELNTLPGLVIVTTNLVSNLDEAMLRRFMIKAQFHLPDAETRSSIWLSKFPSLSRNDADTLAREFSFSGGLIDNVVSMATMDEILYKKPVGLNDLISYCKAQLVGSEQTPTRKIGFNNC